MKVRCVFILFGILGSVIVCYSQQYYSKIFFNDSIGQNGKEVYLIGGDMYILSGRRCLPDFQDCSSFIKLDSDGEIVFEILLPDLDVGNDNALLFWNASFYVTGHRNRIDQNIGYYFYEVSLGGEILDFNHIPLEYTSSTNYTSAIDISTSMLYMCGAADTNGSDPAIDVDGIITSYNLITGESEVEQYDLGNQFLDVVDMHPDTDSTLVFLSRRRGIDYDSGYLDWVIEKIYPDGTRQEIHKTENLQSSDVDIPEFGVLNNGNMVFHLGDHNNATIQFRVLDSEGNFLFDTELENSFWPNFAFCIDIQPLADNGFLVVGNYINRVDPIEKLGENNGMLLKIDEYGEIVWLHHYRHVHPENGEYRESILGEAKEMDNGDIVAIGSVTGSYTSDLWLLKVNSDGCLAEGECGQLVTAVEQVQMVKKYITIYPNPASAGQFINVLYDKNKVKPTSIILRSRDGHIVREIDYDTMSNQVSTDGLVPGLYIY
jgi:hypothetical protein